MIPSTEHPRAFAAVETVESDTRIYEIDGCLLPHPYRFDPGDAAHLSRLRDGRVRFRLVTGPDIVDARLTIRSGDEFRTHTMALELDGSTLRVWSVAVMASDGDEYSLAFLDDHDRARYLTRVGIAGAVERLDRWRVDLGAIATIDVPDWIRGAVMYQVFPDRFANGDPSNDPPDVDPWGADPRRDTFQGGDLAGVVDHLDHLERLGVEVLYLNPVVTSPSNHRYDASDYHHVDPMLGGDAGFDALRTATAERGMRLVVDLSINHCHPRHAAFADVRDRGPDSPYWSWFRVDEWPLQVRYRPHRRPPGFAHFTDADADRFAEETGIPFVTVTDDGPFIETTYDAWYGVPSMPRFDLTNPEARAYLVDVGRHWLTRFDADGIRMDVARYIELDVWRQARPAFRAARDDAYLLCEIFGDAGAWLQGDTFDGVMNYIARDLIRHFCAGGIDGAAWSAGVERMLAAVTPEATEASQVLLGSHDTPRIRTVLGGDAWRVALATFLQFTLPGTPSVYYGDEVGLEGGHDPGMRRAFPWGEEATSPLVADIVDLAALRRSRPSLRSGAWHHHAAGDDWVAFRRVGSGDEVLVVANRGDAPAVVDAGHRAVLWGDAVATGRSVTVAARSGAVLGQG